MRNSIGTAFLLVVVVFIPLVSPAAESDSLKALEAATLADPKDGRAWVRLGHAYLAAGDFKRAKGAFRKGIRSNNRADGYNGLGAGLHARSGLQGGKQEGFRVLQTGTGGRPRLCRGQNELSPACRYSWGNWTLRRP